MSALEFLKNLFDDARAPGHGCRQWGLPEFQGQDEPQKSAGSFQQVLQDKKLFKKYYEYAKERQMANQVDFIRAVDHYKKKPTWESAANIAQVYLTEGGDMYVNIDYFELEDWIRRCCEAEEMLPH